MYLGWLLKRNLPYNTLVSLLGVNYRFFPLFCAQLNQAPHCDWVCQTFVVPRVALEALLWALVGRGSGGIVRDISGAVGLEKVAVRVD